MLAVEAILSKGDEANALKLIEKIYDVGPESGQDSRMILNQLKKQVKKKEVSVSEESYCQSLFGKRYWKGTIVLAMYALN